jgi:hypothetical protein
LSSLPHSLAKTSFQGSALENLREESRLTLGGKVVVLDQRITADDFTSGRVFIGKSSAAGKTEAAVGTLCLRLVWFGLVGWLVGWLVGYLVCCFVVVWVAFGFGFWLFFSFGLALVLVLVL